MRRPKFKSSFKKDRKLLKKRGWNIVKLDAVATQLIMEIPLPKSCREHPLHGNWKGCMDCHVEGDRVVIYEIDDNAQEKTVTFHRTGTHSDLF
jgi:mRNA interferase YafQ